MLGFPEEEEFLVVCGRYERDSLGFEFVDFGRMLHAWWRIIEHKLH